MGTIDRLVRVVIAALIAVLYQTGLISGTLAVFLITIAVILAFSSLISFCPLYALLKTSTTGKKHPGHK